MEPSLRVQGRCFCFNMLLGCEDSTECYFGTLEQLEMLHNIAQHIFWHLQKREMVMLHNIGSEILCRTKDSIGLCLGIVHDRRYDLLCIGSEKIFSYQTRRKRFHIKYFYFVMQCKIIILSCDY